MQIFLVKCSRAVGMLPRMGTEYNIVLQVCYLFAPTLRWQNLASSGGTLKLSPSSLLSPLPFHMHPLPISLIFSYPISVHLPYPLPIYSYPFLLLPFPSRPHSIQLLLPFQLSFHLPSISNGFPSSSPSLQSFGIGRTLSNIQLLHCIKYSCYELCCSIYGCIYLK